jgi:hypothetical protein
MNFLASIALLAAAISPPASYDELYGEAYFTCGGRHLSESQVKVMEDLIEVEHEFFQRHPQMPDSLRGMLLAAACRESRFTSRARGDWRHKRGRRVAMAHGVVQLWPWWERYYGVDRDNHKEAARAWLTHIVHQYNKNKRYNRCPSTFSNERQWVAAWVQVARGGRVNRANRYRCFEIPLHYKTLKKWLRSIEYARSTVDIDGC